ncbi:hypothetical protein ACKFKF_19380 [Phormidesmis sp. 146-12]
MSNLSFTTSGLRSRTTHAAIVARHAAGKVVQKGKGILAKIAKIGGFLFSKVVSYFNLSFDRLWDVLVDAYFELKTFDWNATDKELEKTIEQNNQAIVTAAATGLGEALGWGTVRLANHFIGRFLPGKKGKQLQAIEGMKVPVVSARIGLALAEESNEEMKFAFRRFMQVGSKALASNAFINMVLTSRRNEWFGMSKITEPKPNGSIASKIEQKIEQLPKFWQKPVEAFIDGFEDAIVEAGYVVTMTIDDHIAAQRFASRDVQARRTIEIQPHKDSEEKITFTGTQQEVIDSIRTVMPVHQIIEDKDIGQFMGESPNEVITAKPQLRCLNLIFYGKPSPPYWKGRTRLCQNSTISVPDAKTGISANDIKAALKSYTYGDWYVHCKMDSGRQMQGWFSSHNEGIQTLTALSRLSTSDIVVESFRWSNGKDGGKKSEKMYPSYASIIYPRRKNGKNTGPLGRPVRIPIWGDTPSARKPLQ